MSLRKRKPEQEAVAEVKEAAAPQVALLKRLREEQRRIDAWIEAEIGLNRDV